jgi:DNA-binding MarR family transcriptional regulator
MSDFSFEGLHRILHEKARLSILASLAAHPQGLLFNDIKSLCKLTDGNLSRQVSVLAEEKLVEVWKSQSTGRSQTLVKMSAVGRKRFTAYLAELERVVRAASTAPKTRPATA